MKAEGRRRLGEPLAAYHARPSGPTDVAGGPDGPGSPAPIAWRGHVPASRAVWAKLEPLLPVGQKPGRPPVPPRPSTRSLPASTKITSLSLVTEMLTVAVAQVAGAS